MKEKLGEEKLVPVISFDAIISLSGATEQLADAICQLEPFGASNPEPKIIIEDVSLLNQGVVGKEHIKCMLSDNLGKKLKAIAFKANGTDLGNAICASQGEKFNVAGTLRKDSWQGKTSLQFIIEDIMRV